VTPTARRLTTQFFESKFARSETGASIPSRSSPCSGTRTPTRPSRPARTRARVETASVPRRRRQRPCAGPVRKIQLGLSPRHTSRISCTHPAKPAPAAHRGRTGTTSGPPCPARRTSSRGARQPQPPDPSQNRPEQHVRHTCPEWPEDHVLRVTTFAPSVTSISRLVVRCQLRIAHAVPSSANHKTGSPASVRHPEVSFCHAVRASGHIDRRHLLLGQPARKVVRCGVHDAVQQAA
jgi:hypothetical protein